MSKENNLESPENPLALYHPLTEWLKGPVQAIISAALDDDPFSPTDIEKTIAAAVNFFAAFTERPPTDEELTRIIGKQNLSILYPSHIYQSR